MGYKNQNLDHLTDEDLMSLYQQSDFSAFQKLYSRHSQRVYGYLCAKSKSKEQAQDLMQDVFEKLHKNRSQYDATFPFLPWLFTISRNALLDFYKKSESKVIRNSISDEKLFNNIPSPHHKIASGKESHFSPNDVSDSNNSESSLQVFESPAFDHLPISQKRALELRYLSDWSFCQIANHLKTSEVNARKLISRGIKKLRLSLKKEELT